MTEVGHALAWLEPQQVAGSGLVLLEGLGHEVGVANVSPATHP